jgi:F-type H+/Na+-transporting ATPase subunit alpha
VKKVVVFEAAMQSYLKSHSADLINKINETADYNDGIAAEMKAAIEAFKTNGAY